MMPNKVVVFDLDDTLYKEIDYLKSAYREIAKVVEHETGFIDVYEKMLHWRETGENVFEKLIIECHLKSSVNDLLTLYRKHFPDIVLDEQTVNALTIIKQFCVMGMITDGRSLTQMNKINALSLNRYFERENIMVSEDIGFEKPSEEPYLFFMEKYPQCIYYYIGDNPAKDFLAPNKLGWKTVCLLDSGCNIHHQEFELGMDYLPKYKIKDITELVDIVGE